VIGKHCPGPGPLREVKRMSEPDPISVAIVTEAMYRALRLAATRLPPDVEGALRCALADEADPLARQHLEVSLANADDAAAGEGLVCADTGFPLFYVNVSPGAAIQGGFAALWPAAREATARATADNFLRPTMVHPLDRSNPGDNVGGKLPKIEVRFRAPDQPAPGGPTSDDTALEIIACPKGGGSEIFGTFYRMLYPSDGEAGVLKFAIDAIRDGSYAGKVCPPAIIGLGIGGTAELCMQMAKEAALLRPIGSRHPDPRVAAIEDKLLQASRGLGLGPMGSRGRNAVMAVHADVAHTHTAALPVAVNAQCLVGRRWRALVSQGGDVTYSGVFA
jgi:L(+)-tartrate dehydratase alpha subunit